MTRAGSKAAERPVSRDRAAQSTATTGSQSPGMSCERLLAVRDTLLHVPAERIPLRLVRVGEGDPRRSAETPEPFAAAAEPGERHSPVLVHGPSMTIIDGIRPYRPTVDDGRATIEARFFNGSEEDGRLLAVALDV